MGASKKIIVVEGNGEGGASQKVAVDNAVFVGGDLEAGYIPVVQEDLSVEWQAGGEGTGDVIGFGTSTAGHITVYKDATGKVIQDGGAIPAGGFAGLTALNLRVVGGTTSTIGHIAVFTDASGLEIEDGGEFPDFTEQYVTAPTLPTSTGIKGQRAYSANYIYECVATNTWVRGAVESSWS